MFQSKTPTPATDTQGKCSLLGLNPYFSWFSTLTKNVVFWFIAFTDSGALGTRTIGLSGAWNRFEIGNDEDEYELSSKAYESAYGTGAKGDLAMGKVSIPSSSATSQMYIDEYDLSHMAPNNSVDYTVSDNKYMYDDLSEIDYIKTGDIVSTQNSYADSYTATVTTRHSDIVLLTSTYNSGLYADDVATDASKTAATTAIAAPMAVTSIPTTATTTTADNNTMVTQSQQLLTGDTSNYYCDNSATTVAYNLDDVRQTEDEINQIETSNYLRDVYSADHYLENTHKQLVFNPVSCYSDSLLDILCSLYDMYEKLTVFLHYFHFVGRAARLRPE